MAFDISNYTMSAHIYARTAFLILYYGLMTMMMAVIRLFGIDFVGERDQKITERSQPLAA